jgi:hypothetical protein
VAMAKLGEGDQLGSIRSGRLDAPQAMEMGQSRPLGSLLISCSDGASRTFTPVSQCHLGRCGRIWQPHLASASSLHWFVGHLPGRENRSHAALTRFGTIGIDSGGQPQSLDGIRQPILHVHPSDSGLLDELEPRAARVDLPSC